MQSFHTMQMRFTLGAVLTFLSLAQAAIALELAQPNSGPTDIQNPYLRLSNGTHPLRFPDYPDSFHVTFEIGGPRLHQTACLMNTIEALKQLALGDYDAKIIDGTEFRLGNYPEVSILVNTQKRKRNLRAEYVISAIALGVFQMIKQKKFELAQFELSMEDQVIGWVHVVDNPSTAGLTIGRGPATDIVDVAKRSTNPNSSNSSESYGVNVANVTTSDLATDPDEARLKTTFTPFGGKVGIYDVFLPIINALSDIAEYPGSRVTNGLVATFEGCDAAVCILQNAPERTGRPLIEYQWLIRTLSRIPAFMVEGHRFGEIQIAVEVDGVEIASGKLKNVADCL